MTARLWQARQCCHRLHRRRRHQQQRQLPPQPRSPPETTICSSSRLGWSAASATPLARGRSASATWRAAHCSTTNETREGVCSDTTAINHPQRLLLLLLPQIREEKGTLKRREGVSWPLSAESGGRNRPQPRRRHSSSKMSPHTTHDPLQLGLQLPPLRAQLARPQRLLRLLTLRHCPKAGPRRHRRPLLPPQQICRRARHL